MKARWVALGVTTGLLLALTVGFAFVSSRTAGRATPAPAEADDPWETMDAMHDSAFMQHIRAQMGAEWASQCDALHEQMRERYGQNPGGMMGGYGPGEGTGYGPGNGPRDGTGYGPGPAYGPGPGPGPGMMGPGGMMGS